jgi:phospholipid/cholesterol/gamma-HCH transport system substrate-binding protein
VNLPNKVVALYRTIILAVLVALSAFVFGYFWLKAGGKIPLISHKPYTVSFSVPRVDNLVKDSDVDLAGVSVGNVRNVKPTQQGAIVTVGLTDNAPLHKGAHFAVRNKTLIAETFVDITDGRGAALQSGSMVRDSATPAVTLDDVLRSLNHGDREALASSIRSLGKGTEHSQADIASAMTGLGYVSRKGGTALSALASQKESLKQLSSNTAELLRDLDTRNGEIAELVTDTNKVTKATSGNRQQLATTMKKLPGVLYTAKKASGSLSQLSHGLQPVAANLNKAAPNLNVALKQLPQTTHDLRTLLPYLNGTLDRAPATLTRVPKPAKDLESLMPLANRALANLNPMLTYIKPYGPDVASFFTNFGQTLSSADGNGTMLRVMLVFNEQSLRNLPINTQVGFLNKNDPYPAPGVAGKGKSAEKSGRNYTPIKREPLNSNGN